MTQLTLAKKTRKKIFATHVVRPSNTTLVLFILCPPVYLSLSQSLENSKHLNYITVLAHP